MNDDEILFADLIRDGGSAFISARLSGQKIAVRVMPSFGERKSDLFGKYEVRVDDTTTIVDTLDQIEGLEALIRAGHHDLREHVVKAFLYPQS